MLTKLVRGIRKHERLAVIILALVTALILGIPSVLLNLLSKEEPETTAYQMFGQRITKQEFLDVKRRWQILTALYIKQSGFLSAGLFPFNMAKHNEIVLFQENRLVRTISSSKESYVPPDDKYYNDLARVILVLCISAERTGIKITDSEVRTHIEGYSIFRPRQDGFNVMRYRNELRNLSISETVFEKTIKELLLTAKYANLVVEPAFPTLEQVYQAYRRNNEEIKISCVVFKAEDFKDEVKIKSSEEIDRFLREKFDDKNNKYRIAEKVQVEYILADYELAKKTVQAPTLEELKDYYEKNRDTFPITTTDGSMTGYKSFEQVKEEVESQWLEQETQDLTLNNIIQAEQKKRQLFLRDKPVDLATIAREFSLKYGTTGFFSRERIVEIEKEVGSSGKFTNLVFTYPEKEISDYLSTSKGFMIFRVVKKKEARLPEFTMDFKKKVVKDLKKKKARELAKKRADELAQEILDKISEELKHLEDKPDSEKEDLIKEIKKEWFKNILMEQDLSPVETLYFKRTDFIPELPESSFQFADQAVDLPEGDFKVISETVGSELGKEIPKIYYLTQVTAHRLPTGDDFEAQKAGKTGLEAQVRKKEFEEFFEKWRAEIRDLADKLKPKTTD